MASMDLEEVKVCLRALLSSNPLSYHVNSLLNDFKSTTGCNLPLFGYPNPVEFLKSMKDTLKLHGDLHNPEVALIESQKSAHIISLVGRQKINEKINTKNPYIMAKERRQVVHIKDTGNFYGLQEKSNSSLSLPNYKQPGDVEMKFTLPNPVNHQNLFGNNAKKPILQLPGILHSIPTQLKSVKQTLPINSYTADPEPQKKFFNQKLSSVPAPNKPQLEKAPPEPPEKITDNNFYFEDVSDNDSCPGVKSSKSDSSHDSSSGDFINSGIKSKLQKLIKNHPNGLWCCELPELFFEEFNFVLDYREYGYTSLIQMLSELPDVFRCVRPGNEDWILFDASAPPSAEEKKISDFHLRGERICGIKANIQKLLAKCCENSSFGGMELDKISDTYQKMFGTSLDFDSLGFKDVKSLLEIWEGSILNIVSVGGKFFCEPAFNRTVHSPVRWEEALPPITAENDIFIEIFPKNVVGPEETLSHLDLSRHIAVGHLVEVSVAEVWSPSKFFVQLNKFKNRLIQFMDDLQKFYNVHLNKFKMPDSTLRPNQVCVGLYNADPEFPEEWHRAQIIKVINEKTVLINFVDYGTVTRVKKTQLRFLHRIFQSFPIQAFQAQLSGVVPPNDEAVWPMTTSKKFLELLRVPYLNAEMVDIDFKKPALSVILFNPFQKSNINKKLVSDKLARAGKPLYFREEVPQTQLPETETKKLSENSSGVLVQANESFGKTVPEIRDQFLDIDDLNHSTLFQFKMKNFPPDLSPSKEKDIALEKTEGSYEFEYIPDLEDGDAGKKIAVEAKKNNSEDGSVRVTQVPSESTLPDPGKEDVKRPAPTEVTEEQSKISSPGISSSKPKRLPPGLEYLNCLPDSIQIPLFLQPEDLKKKINALAMELLTKNASIKQVAMNNPALALQIATEMAEAYMSSELSMNLPLYYNLFSLFPQPLAEDVDPSMPSPKKPAEDTTLSPEILSPQETADHSGASASETSPEKVNRYPSPESKEFVEETQIGGKILHLVKIDNELYFCSEEVVQQFTSFPSRERADLILRAKKIKTDYRIISKKSDEKVLKLLKSSNLRWGVKRKEKKLRIYLLPVAKVESFLQALGCWTKAFENDILELQKNWEEKFKKCGSQKIII